MIYKNKKILIIITFILIGILFFMLNYYTSLYVDNYSYSFSFMDGSKINNIKDVILSQKAHYININGRSIVHTIAQFFYITKTIF